MIMLHLKDARMVMVLGSRDEDGQSSTCDNYLVAAAADGGAADCDVTDDWY